MIKEFMHIPEAARAAQHVFNGEQLPTEDFFTGLERKLMLCSEHVIHTYALNEELTKTRSKRLERGRETPGKFPKSRCLEPT